MDKRKGYVLLINAGVRNSESERKKYRRLLHYVLWHPIITLASKRAFRVLLLELVNQRRVDNAMTKGKHFCEDKYQKD